MVKKEQIGSTGMFINDDEIRADYPADADQIIADLDADPATQKGKATRPPEARYRPKVEEYLRLRAEQQSR